MHAAIALEVHPHTEPRPRISAAARRLVILSLAGTAVAALTWRATTGLGWLVATVILSALIVGGLARGRPGTAGWALAGASLWLAGVACWRASDWALVTALPSSYAALAALALVCARKLRPAHLERVAPAAWDALRELPGAARDVAKWPADALDTPARSQARGALRGVAVGLPLALVFGAILAADEGFRAALGSLASHTGASVSFGIWMVASIASMALAAAVLLRIRSEPSDDAQESAASLFAAQLPYRMSDDDTLPSVRVRITPRLSPVTWGVAMAQIVAVFGIYAGANARSLFAGHAFFQARGTPTYAATVHEGFVQVTIAALLAVACVVAGHALLRVPGSVGRTPGGRALAAIELALVGLAALALASSAHRLSLYEQAYGYTTLRLAVRCFQIGVAGLLALTAAGCVARASRGWTTALAWSGMLMALIVGSLDADDWVAGRSVERARTTGRLDVGYLQSLSEDARPALAGADDVLATRPYAALTLNAAWARSAAAHRTGDWRSWRGLGGHGFAGR